MLVTRTPYRISLLGGGSDYEDYFSRYGGCVITTAIDKYCYVGISRSGEVWSHDELPSGSGMGTSSAFAVGLFTASHRMGGKETAALATGLELKERGGACGYQDQYICAVGGFKRLRFYGSGVVEEELDYDWLEPYLMLVDTGIYRQGGVIIRHQLDRMDRNLKTLHELKDLALQDYDDPVDFGNALHTAWRLKRNLSDDVSTNKVDEYYRIALEAGALGGKLLGGGGGGFMVFVVNPDDRTKVSDALRLSVIDFRFDKEGSKIIYESRN